MLDILELKEKGIRKKIVILHNKRLDVSKEFVLRSFQTGDEKGIISCVKEEHGNTYFKKFFYDPLLLKEKAEGEEYVIFVAEADNRIAAIEILRIFSKRGEDYIEPASQIICKDYRGYGLSGALVDYTFSVAISIEPSALFVHTAMYHSITQHVCEAYGMEPVGYEIGSFLTEAMKNSFALDGIKKYSAGTLCYPVKKKEAGDIYLPPELKDYGAMVYQKLDAKYEIITKTDDTFREKESVLYISRENSANRYVSIIADCIGIDFAERMDDLIHEHTKGSHNPDGWVYLLVLNTDTPEFLHIYEELKKMGFFFGGLQPLCGIHERAFMYWVGDLDLKMDAYVVTEKFAGIRDWISKYYLNRIL